VYNSIHTHTHTYTHTHTHTHTHMAQLLKQFMSATMQILINDKIHIYIQVNPPTPPKT